MLRKINKLLNIIIVAFIGVFIGNALYVYWEYESHPGLYAMNSAPWYTSILVTGLFTLVVVIIAVIIKLIIKIKSPGKVNIIKAPDGPTAIYTAKKRKGYTKENQEAFLTYAATQITANSQSFSDIESLLVSQYHAQPYTLSKNELDSLKANVIMTNFKEVLISPRQLPENPSRAQILEHNKNSTIFEQARNYPSEKLGLVMKAYKIPIGTNRECTVSLEMTTEYMTISDANKDLADELFLLRGVSQYDIDNKTPRFIAYASILRNMGKLSNWK